MSLQTLFNEMALQWQKERSQSQMTLGQMIDYLKTLDPNTEIQGFCSPHSYRGYYQDLAFEPIETEKVSVLLELCYDALGEEYEGYKGGEFIMHKNTPIWIASYGCCGKKIIGYKNGKLELEEDA